MLLASGRGCVTSPSVSEGIQKVNWRSLTLGLLTQCVRTASVNPEFCHAAKTHFPYRKRHIRSNVLR
jgi:hypothetical protein